MARIEPSKKEDKDIFNESFNKEEKGRSSLTVGKRKSMHKQKTFDVLPVKGMKKFGSIQVSVPKNSKVLNRQSTVAADISPRT